MTKIVTFKVSENILWEIERIVRMKPYLYQSRSDFIRKAIELLLDAERAIELEEIERSRKNTNNTVVNKVEPITLEECLKMCEEIEDNDPMRRKRRMYHCKRMCREQKRPSVAVYIGR